MKLIFLGLLCSAWFAHASAQASLTPGYEALTGITKRVTVAVLELLGDQLQDLNLEGGNVRFPVLPNFTDPLNLNDTGLLTFTNALIRGEFMARDNVINGLSTLIDDAAILPIVPLGVSVQYSLEVSDVAIGGFYETDLDILSGGIKFAGSGDYSIQLTQGFVDLYVRTRVIGLTRVEITTLEFNLGFESLNIDIQGATFNGVEANWTEINPELKRIFDIYWPVLNAKIVPNVLKIVNHLIETCTITELIGLKLECLNDEPLPEITSAPEQTNPAQSTMTGTEQTTGSEQTPASTETESTTLETAPNSAAVTVLSTLTLLSTLCIVLL